MSSPAPEIVHVPAASRAIPRTPTLPMSAVRQAPGSAPEAVRAGRTAVLAVGFAAVFAGAL